MNAGSTVAFGYEGTYDRNVSFKAKTDTQKATYNPEFNQLITFTEFVSFQNFFFFRVVKLKEYFISKKKKKKHFCTFQFPPLCKRMKIQLKDR